MTVYGISKKGPYREENQDAILIRETGRSGLFIVADGVGGAANGAEVSRFIVGSYDSWWNEVFLENQEDSFQALFEHIKARGNEINQDVCQTYGAGNSAPTIVLLFIHKGIGGYLSAGDSRIYRSNRSGTRLITRDDVWENRPGADQRSVHSGKIISAVGSCEEFEYSCATDRVHMRDVFMLCSDGIYKYVEEPFLAEILAKGRKGWLFDRDVMEKIVKRAVERDTKDNYSIITIRL